MYTWPERGEPGRIGSEYLATRCMQIFSLLPKICLRELEFSSRIFVSHAFQNQLCLASEFRGKVDCCKIIGLSVSEVLLWTRFWLNILLD